MNKERIIKLLESTCLDDILLGVQLSYNLPFKEFDALYTRREVNLKDSPNLYYRFWRNNIKYGFGSKCFIKVNWYDDRDVDITPENFENEKGNYS